MKKIRNELLIQKLTKDTKDIIDTVKEEVLHQEQTRLCWKSEKKKWNVLECLQHLIQTHHAYLPQIQQNIQRANSDTQKNTVEYLPGRIGNYVAKLMKPQNGVINGKINTLRAFDPQKQTSPNASLDKNALLNEFMEQQELLLECLQKSVKLDLGRIKITSPLGNILRFKLGDAFRFLIAHNQRHILQVLRILEQQKQQTSLID